jgi:hypothetical protein
MERRIPEFVLGRRLVEGVVVGAVAADAAVVKIECALYI